MNRCLTGCGTGECGETFRPKKAFLRNFLHLNSALVRKVPQRVIEPQIQTCLMLSDEKLFLPLCKDLVTLFGLKQIGPKTGFNAFKVDFVDTNIVVLALT